MNERRTTNDDRNPNNKKVAVAMSGGVDSSVTAGLLKNQGYDVVGITMQVWPLDEFTGEASRFGGCCSLSAVEDARRVAAKLKIPHYVLNFRSVFQETVIDNFLDEYRGGRTPNPCIRCNQHVKFEALLKKATSIGCDYLATGHYVRVLYDEKSSRYLLLRGIDEAKDQSYVLYVMTQDQLKKTIFPLGDYRKSEIRKLAKEMNFEIADKPESQEICFIPSKSYADYIVNAVPDAAREGEIVNKEGNVLGRHKGLIYYTCGQRKGLGITSEKPLYVIEIDKEKNRVVVGGEQELYGDKLVADELNMISISKIKEEMKVEAQIRYNSNPQEATVFPIDGGKVEVVFRKAQKAISPGQAVVFYDSEIVVGGGTIEKAFTL